MTQSLTLKSRKGHILRQLMENGLPLTPKVGKFDAFLHYHTPPSTTNLSLLNPRDNNAHSLPG